MGRAPPAKQLEHFVASLSHPIQKVTADSRRVSAGDVFVAIPGRTFDGHDFIPQAIRNGAVAVVGERPGLSTPVPTLAVPDARWALAYLSALLHSFPARQLIMVGVTGTDGKTTTANLIHSILVEAGIKAGMITTINVMLGDRVEETGLHVTTPEATTVQRYLSEMVKAGMTHCVLEATSHGLAQHRVSACDFDVAAVTNVTHEHLDYHGGHAAYLAAKAMLFEGLHSSARKSGQTKTAILNADDSSYEHFSHIPADRIIGYAFSERPTYRSGPPDLFARQLINLGSGASFELVAGGQAFPIRSNLVGRYNVSNMLAAAGVGLALRIAPKFIQRGIAGLVGIPGRMEAIEGGQPFQLVVDFAHTPNALCRVIETGRELVRPEGRVIAVFGSAGLRDVAKRRLMAEVSVRYADLTVLTAEDPRTESLDLILDQMAAGCAAVGGREGETFFRIPDRMRAIYFGLSLARPEDIVLICGKGHEQSMCFGADEYPWDDRQAARRALSAFLDGRPPPNSGLPTF